MRKYENMDIIATLGTVLEINTEHYRGDFKYDIDMFKEAAANPAADKHFLWLSRQNGTECFKEREAYLQGIAAHNSWKYFANSKTPIRAYAVEITGLEKGRIVGNLYELNHPAHVEQLVKDALPVQTVEVLFKDGSIRVFPFEEYNGHFMAIQNEYGRIWSEIYHPDNEGELQSRIQKARDERQGYTPAVFKARIRKRQSISDQLRAGKEMADKQQAGKSKASVKDSPKHEPEL